MAPVPPLVLSPTRATDRHLVVVGASLAGVRAVEGARAAGWAGPITLVGAEALPPYDRPPLSKDLLAPGAGLDVPLLRTDDALAGLGVDLRLGARAVGLDTSAHFLALEGAEVRYDALVIATGATARGVPALDGVAGVHRLRTYADALATRRALDSAQRVVVVGGGFIGSEVASAARARGLSVTLVEAAEQPLARAVGPLAASLLLALHAEAGVDVRAGVSVAGAETVDGRVRAVALADGTTIPADAVVVGIGAAPATAWLAGSALALDAASGAVVCDDELATSAPGVWAAGDVACVGGVAGQHWTCAAEQGRLAGANAAGAGERHDAVPFAWSTWHAHRVQTVGETALGQELAEEPAEEELAEPGLVLVRRGGRLVGAVGIDAPGAIARVRRELRASGQERRVVVDRQEHVARVVG